MAKVRVLDAAALVEFDGNAPGKAAQDFARAFTHELMTTGLCGLQSCGVAAALRQELAAVGEDFFALAQDEKDRVAMQKAGRAWRGYFRTGTELTAGRPDLKEGYYFGVEHGPDHPLVRAGEVMHGSNIWPEGPLGQRMASAVMAYQAAAKTVCRRLMVALAWGLGCGPNTFDDLLSPEPTELFRIFHYPPVSGSAPDDGGDGSAWGVGEHTDMGFLTLLLQGGESTALEVRTRDGIWCEVPPEPGALYVNIGDMLEYVTRGLLWATPHRVRASRGEGRLSFPYFFDPSWTCRLAPLPEDVLRRAGWRADLLMERGQVERWDRLRLHDLSAMSYGAFVWGKVRHVFPWLAGDARP